MWFQSDSPLPPGSDPDNTPTSSSINIAYSTNGLHWECGKGAYELLSSTPPTSSTSATPSTVATSPGAVLKPNTDSWWNFDTYSLALGTVLTPTLTPTLRVERGVHIMYYSGSNFESGGSNGKIGIAISQDGESWGRVEGEDPSGASIVPNEIGGWVGQPEVSFVVDESTVGGGRRGEVKGTFWMHYVEGVGKGEYGDRVNAAASSDGFNWVESKRNVMTATPDSPDAGGIGSLQVLKSMTWDPSSSVWRDSPGYTMYYSAVDSAGRKCVCEAFNESPAMTGEWRKRGELELPGENVGGPNVIRMPDGEERMYYHATTEEGERQIVAAERREGGEWKVIAKNINLPDL
ncbi:hypothetical protein TrCOL_g9084 [Triparma columacea]|uniref:Uncharacterized protein n=1 Tax=Triparma columacea TaxID=722753 RepID=A0A9W7GFU7_9STRA|nr:hypothetical protein TrCOL_g9084 [Triparma columacea]